MYSIDEVLMDVTEYLHTYHMSAQELAREIIVDVLNTTGITAAAGIGTNLFCVKWRWISWPSISRRTKTGADRRTGRDAFPRRTLVTSASDGFLACG